MLRLRFGQEARHADPAIPPLLEWRNNVTFACAHRAPWARRGLVPEREEKQKRLE